MKVKPQLIDKKGRLKSLVKAFAKRRILVIGDVGIDRYVTGEVERISPEAPVPIVFVTSEVHKLGLAANVSDNIHALGGDSELVGLVGKDRFASEIRALLRKSKISDRAMIADPKRRTIVKERIVSERQQLLRIDYETPEAITKTIETAILSRVKSALRGRNSVDAVIIQDYAKGMLSKNLVRAIVKLCRSAKTPVLMDPNSKSPLDLYEGATFITPNTREAEILTGISIKDDASLESVGARLLRVTGSPYVVVTRGKDGMAIFSKGSRKPKLIPTYAREVYDVSGAGDTVISIMALAYASGATIEEAAILGNLGGGVVVGKRGTATVTPAELDEAMGVAAGFEML
jgi:D-glycero-beta-D-manno-heptose-7-phosphate kinase